MPVARRVSGLVFVFVLSIAGAMAASPDADALARDLAAIERVQDAHRLWPAGNAGTRPPLERRVGPDVFLARAERVLEQTAELRSAWHVRITGPMLQAELDRMARESRDPARLAELFRALGDDPRRAAEALARPALAERLLERAMAAHPHGWPAGRARAAAAREPLEEPAATFPFRLPALAPATGPNRAPQGCNVWDDPAKIGAPHALTGATAVWTGTEVLFFGGVDANNGRPNTVQRYTPATDTWQSSRATVNGPVGRSEHTAVWTGTTMIVWGGNGGTYAPYLNSGAIYDPASDTWSAMFPGPMPRYGHTAVWTGTKMIVFGGTTQYVGDTADGSAYDPLSDSWTSLPTPPTSQARVHHTATWTGTEMVVYGGTSGGTYLSNWDRYNPSTNAWTPISYVGWTPVARAGQGAIWTGEPGRAIVVWGGQNASGYVAQGAAFYPDANQWVALSSTGQPSARTAHVMAWDADAHLVLVWGGTNGAVLADGGRYAYDTDTWSAMSTAGAPLARSVAAAAWDGGEFVVWGGQDAAGNKLDSGARYDPAGDAWNPMQPERPGPRSGHTAVWTGSEMIVWGGSPNTNTGGSWDPATATWTALPVTADTPEARSGHKAVWTGTQMIVWGGSGAPGQLATGGVYDPATRTWRATSALNAPSARQNHAMAWAGGRAIVWGGLAPGNVLLADGAAYDPTTDTWTPTSMTGAPSARYQHTAVSTGSRMIVWGGSSLNDGGIYDPATDTWTPTSTTGAPGGRSNHVAVWTGTQMIVAGGHTFGNHTDSYVTGGVYTPATNSWTPTASTTVMFDLSNSAAAWNGHEMLFFAGQRQLCSGWTCKWTTMNYGARYDPAVDTWTAMPRVDFTPSARGLQTAVWGAGALLVFGGSGAATFDDGGIFAQEAPGSPADTLRVLKSSTIDLAWGAVGDATSYAVRRCAAALGPCVPTDVVATPVSPSWSDANDPATYFYSIDAVNDCGSAP